MHANYWKIKSFVPYVSLWQNKLKEENTGQGEEKDKYIEYSLDQILGGIQGRPDSLGRGLSEPVKEQQIDSGVLSAQPPIHCPHVIKSPS